MKRLIFAALFATVAIGGAHALTYSTAQGSGDVFSCSGAGTPTCIDQIPSGKAYLYPNGTTLVDLPEEHYTNLPD